ncbi:DUF2155 domain-containing protein [Ponticoccus alexandrii]|uniref:DUF2155 domain-containing protein n=1 Tax=Ponticoccus alexandrii TaxID=1943633 RepID=A0ABX7FA90_9RHOB|nr:DUF2155 domain-containing protein [Ponticoccus alexandrii]ETA50385.1 hypothetical protein P279_20015 [Rhodobacteraceae bacterium PD-2]QRF67303.1 DUF2155 domain-containing protein [Ponticoccus alexandrii]
MRLIAFLMLLAGAASAQEAVDQGTGAVLRGLDKLNAATTDMTIANGQRAAFGVMEVELGDCRYPSGNPSGDAYAFLTIREAGVAEPVFRGWMVASSPALNPMNHPRYDVWVLRCSTS